MNIEERFNNCPECKYVLDKISPVVKHCSQCYFSLNIDGDAELAAHFNTCIVTVREFINDNKTRICVKSTFYYINGLNYIKPTMNLKIILMLK